MRPPPRPFPGLTGRGRRARWRRSVLRRMLAACCLGAAVLAGLLTLRPPPPSGGPLLVAARPVEGGSVLTTADVALVDVVASARPPGAFATVDDVVGRRLGSGLAAGEAVTASRLVPRGPPDGLGRGQVALHVVLADPAAVDLVATGGRVAVYPATGGPPLADHARVLAVDPADRSAIADVTGSSGPPRGLVLALSEDAAQAVLGGHGGLEGPPVVNVVAVGG